VTRITGRDDPWGRDVPPAAEPALGLLEFDSIAAGIAAGDAMAKRAPIEVLHAGTVHPGRYLVLVGGAVADVEEALDAGRAVGVGALLDSVFLPHVHPAVSAAIAGVRRQGTGEALGVIETPTVASIIDAADAGVKGARVRLLELRLADGLGGKGYLLFDGPVAEVEAAVELGTARIAAKAGTAYRVIAQLHAEMRENLAADPRFGERVRHPAGPQSALHGDPGAEGPATSREQGTGA
jgi:microcompartment protein CcmL/EutN